MAWLGTRSNGPNGAQTLRGREKPCGPLSLLRRQKASMAAMTAAGGPPTAAAPAAPSNEVVEINDLLDKTKCYCLNEASARSDLRARVAPLTACSPVRAAWPRALQKDGSFANLFIGMDDLTLKSDADEQLLMQFAFKDTVRLHSLNITAPIDDSAPQTVKARGARAAWTGARQ